MAITKTEILAGLKRLDKWDSGLLRKILRTLTTDVTAQETLLSAGTETLTASAAVTAGTTVLYLDHITVAIAATMDVSTLLGTFIVEAITEPGVAADHTLTVSGGTLDGTNTIATFADINDKLVIYFDGAGNGNIISNTGAVVLS